MRYCCDSNGQPVGMPQKHVIGSEAGLDQRQLALWVASQSVRQAKQERTVDRAKTNCCWNRFVQSCTSHGQCDAGGYSPGPEGSPTSFQARAPLPEPLQEVQAAAHGQFVYVAGGINSDRQASYSVVRSPSTILITCPS